MNPESYYKLVENVVRDGKYGKLITIVEIDEEGNQTRTETFTPIFSFDEIDK